MAYDEHGDDRALVMRIAAHDQTALSELYASYSKAVFNVALYVLQNRVLAEEITQDVFFLLWRTPDKWSPDKGRLGSWLLAVTRYMAVDRLRHEQSRASANGVPLEDLADTLEVKSLIQSPDDAALLRSLLQRLPKDQMQVLFLTYFRGMTHTEIADHLNLPVGTIKSRLRLSLSKLREWWHEAVKEL